MVAAKRFVNQMSRLIFAVLFASLLWDTPAAQSPEEFHSQKENGGTMSESFASTGLGPQPYQLEWKRTKPDYVVFLPAPDGNPRWHDKDFFVLNEHFIVVSAGDANLLAFWTAWGPGLKFLRVVTSRSTDSGKTWSDPHILDGPGSGEDELSAMWLVPIVAPSGRVYCVYNKSTGVVDRSRADTGIMRCRYSDDGGLTWSKPTALPIRRSPIDNPDSGLPSNWIAWRQPEVDRQGRILVTFTRWASPKAPVAIPGQYSQCEVMRFENLGESPPPEEIQITWLPEGDPVTVPNEQDPASSFAQEASVVPLPDGRLFMAMRTIRGTIWYTVSDDEGATWRDTQVMRYSDDGDEVLQPVSPAPLYRMKNGQFLLLFNNNDGHVFGSKVRWTPENRRPAFLSLGEFRPDARQPIWFSEPKMFIDNDGIPIDIIGNAPRYDAAPYTSFTEVNGERVIWYPDRKHFLLGKRMPDAFLADMRVTEWRK